jgi:hypothetical protein
MDSKTIEQYRQKIKEQFGVGSEYAGSGALEVRVREELQEDLSGTLHEFRLTECPKDDSGYDKCWIEDRQGQPVLWHLLPSQPGKSVKTLPYGMARLP